MLFPVSLMCSRGYCGWLGRPVGSRRGNAPEFAPLFICFDSSIPLGPIGELWPGSTGQLDEVHVTCGRLFAGERVRPPANRLRRLSSGLY